MKHISNNFVYPMRTKKEVANLLGHKIRDLRIQRKLTMQELAMEAGMDYSQLSRIERGTINTSVYHIYLLSRVLDVPMHTIFKEAGAEHSDPTRIPHIRRQEKS